MSLIIGARAADTDYQPKTRVVAGLAQGGSPGLRGVMASIRPKVDEGRRLLHVVGDKIADHRDPQTEISKNWRGRTQIRHVLFRLANFPLPQKRERPVGGNLAGDLPDWLSATRSILGEVSEGGAHAVAHQTAERICQLG